MFVQGLGGKLVESSGGTTWFLATNHLGTIAARMNVSGTLMETYRYLPYGERYAGTHTPRQYTGKERDAESGLDYFGARYLASAHGRWMSVDPEIPYVLDPQSLNRYGHTRSNPVTFIDADGGRWILPEGPDIVITIVFGGIVGITWYVPESPPGERGGGPGPGVGSIPQPPNQPLPPEERPSESRIKDYVSAVLEGTDCGNAFREWAGDRDFTALFNSMRYLDIMDPAVANTTFLELGITPSGGWDPRHTLNDYWQTMGSNEPVALLVAFGNIPTTVALLGPKFFTPSYLRNNDLTMGVAGAHEFAHYLTGQGDRDLAHRITDKFYPDTQEGHDQASRDISHYIRNGCE